jgi:phosphoglycolate phosphatase-like HAD superfamily hydrolase
VVARVREHHLAHLGISRFKKFAWIAANILGEKLSEVEGAALGERFGELALSKVLACPFVPGAATSLQELARSLPLVVASGTPQGELDLIIKRRGIASHFAEVHGSPSEKPAVVRALIERLRISPTEVLFIGDGMSDYLAAREVGVEFLARDTPALHDDWVRLGVRRTPDLERLPILVAEW